jgi:hypothetical protein
MLLIKREKAFGGKLAVAVGSRQSNASFHYSIPIAIGTPILLQLQTASLQNCITIKANNPVGTGVSSET